MIFRRSLVHEMNWFASGLFVVLLLVVMTSQIVRLLGEAAIGALASGAVWTVMGFAAVRYLPILFCLMLFITVLTTITRLWRDSEMVIWFASGRSIHDFLDPVLRFAVPVVIFTAILSLFVSPWSMQKSREYREHMLRQQETTQIAPGVFRETKGADRVYFVENFSTDTQEGNNVFVQIRRNDKIAVITAKRGGMIVDETGARWLSLDGGRAVEGTPGSAAYDTMEFAKGRVRLDSPQKAAVDPATQALPTLTLLKSDKPHHQAELAWRIALPVSALILSILALPLAFYNVRGGRTFNLLFALALAFLYYNCINIAQAWIGAGKLPALIGMWPLHAAFAGLAAFLMHRRAQMGAKR
ncbi:lipopolysaccharide export system permease protein [Formivibrio citricus]|uniref:Lipopolysaccharide export system permease protein LptF n=1 Tax=Formivibrio citricus TaxID=83765 RepID=A0A1I5CCZ1_9NEIS|nr:LPS export ABC transporter permease LptF [Formivibrio citricus]SFN84511.1 lipopolysaccharide export system permease protein [Formivibrio citricus]